MRLVAACVLVLALVAPRVARADDREAARAAFKEGEAAEKRKDWRGAIESYLRAYDLSPHPFTLYNVAVNYERVGELRESATFYRRYLDESQDAQDRARVERLLENLRKRPSTITIRTTPPGGELWLDGASIGRAPATRDVPGGSHTVVARHGDRKQEKKVSVEYGEPQDVVLELSAQQGSLTIGSNVNGAIVEIDGQAVGATPLTIDVPAGKHQVIVRAEGYSTSERTVVVPAEGSSQITATLVRPLGYVEPENPAVRSYVAGIEVARALGVDRTYYHVAFGYRIMSVDVLGRIGSLGDSTFGYGLELRLFLTRTRIRPYLSGVAEYAASTSSSSSDTTVRGIVGGAGGIMIQANKGAGYGVDFLIEGGVVWVFDTQEERQMGFPIGGSIVIRR